jgi:shikimate dehydrogenase
VRRFGLIGYPLEHSFSQKYFTKKFKQENIENCYYELFPIASLDLLNDIFISHPDLEGLNVTIPFKRPILKYLNSVANLPEGMHACNCIKLVDGRLIGYNTDVIAFEKSLTPLLKPQHKKALVLGNGGAAAAVSFVLNKLGIEFLIVGREMTPGIDRLFADVDEEVMMNHLLIINTTPVGMFPNIEHVPPIPMDFITRDHVCYDLIYNPERTLFLRQAESWGAAIKNGHEMLVIQAEESWKIWNEKV